MSAARRASICGSHEWRRLRLRLLARLEDDLGEGLVDEDIVPILRLLNSSECIATSSSCSGRIAVFAAPSPGDKARGGIVAKWHRRVEPRELMEAVEEALRGLPGGFVWASAQPVVLALHACSQEAAEAVVRAAVRAGFKYTGYRLGSIGDYYVTVQGVERIDVPLRVGGVEVPIGYDALASLLNTYLSLAKAKLERLHRSLAAELPLLRGCSQEEVS